LQQRSMSSKCIRDALEVGIRLLTHFSVFRAHGMCLAAANVGLLHSRELTALPKSLAGFDVPLRGEERDGKRGKKG